MLALVVSYNPSDQSQIHMFIRFMRQSSMQSKAFLKVKQIMTVHFVKKLHVTYGF